MPGLGRVPPQPRRMLYEPRYVFIRIHVYFGLPIRQADGMRIRTTRKVIYAVTALTALALVSGFAVASIAIGGSNTSHQGSQTTIVANVTGLNWNSTSLIELGNATNNTVCTLLSPCSVTSSSPTDCAGGVASHTGCGAGDFVEQVILTTVSHTPFSGTLKITMYVSTGSGTDVGTSFYYTQTSAANGVQTITQDFDIGSWSTRPGPVTAVSVVIND